MECLEFRRTFRCGVFFAVGGIFSFFHLTGLGGKNQNHRDGEKNIIPVEAWFQVSATIPRAVAASESDEGAAPVKQECARALVLAESKSERSEQGRIAPS